LRPIPPTKHLHAMGEENKLAHLMKVAERKRMVELLKVQTNKNHYQLKSQLYFSALQQAFQVLRNLQSELSAQSIFA